MSVDNAHHERLTTQDQEIERQNKRLQTAFNSVQRLQGQLQQNWTVPQHENAVDTMERATEQFRKMVEKSRSNLGTGSGKVGILLPESEGTALNLRRMDST